MIARLRSISGMTLFAFVLCHLTNHAFGLISITLMQELKPWFLGFWRSPPGEIVLLLAMVVHLGIALWVIYARQTLAMPRWQWLQLASGLLIPFLLIKHVVGTKVAQSLGILDPTYELILAILWVTSPVDGVVQAAALLVVWFHAVVGLHYWFRVKDWYRGRVFLLLASLALLIPTLAMAGYISAGFELRAELDRDHMLNRIITDTVYNRAGAAGLLALMPWLYLGAGLLLALPFAARMVRAAFASYSRRTHPCLLLPDGKRLTMQPGATALETLRAHKIPHAAVCGGRGRCTTCRVRVLTGQEGLDPPRPLEEAALKRINALDSVRLACQMRPATDIGISPLLPPDASAGDGKRPGGIEGEERPITCVFLDMRGSTKMGEEKLPYDVLFILNQFFSEMNQAIKNSNGHYSQFTGDGLMALYGLGGDAMSVGDGVRAAIHGAREMITRLEALNKSLESELPFPLRIGIGIHHGEAIVGLMGPPQALTLTAIGDSINTTARLEGLTKDYAVPLIISRAAARAADLALDPACLHTAQVRGRDEEISFYALEQVPEI